MLAALRNLVVLGLGLSTTFCLGQCEAEEPRPPKANKLFERAMHPKGKKTLEERIESLNQALDLHPEDPEMLINVVELLFRATKNNPECWDELEDRLNQFEASCPDGLPQSMYMRGAIAYIHDDYERALEEFTSYLAMPEDVTRASRRREIQSMIPGLEFLRQYHLHEHEPPPMPIPEVSLDADEYLPLLAPDGSLLFFTRTSVTKGRGDIVSTRRELFTWAQRQDDQMPFDAGVPLKPPFNVGSNYGGATISVDNKLMVLAANRPVPKNPNNIDLFSTEYHVESRDEDGLAVYSWTELKPLSTNVNTEDGWEAQPAISGDGKTLFFAGARAESMEDANGNKTMDIYACEKMDDGSWGPATRLPSPINSSAHDKAPFMHPDGRTLYFSSDRLPSGGGYDLWMSQRDSSGQWSEPVNLGLPINSSGDEHGLVVSTDGAQGIFASRRTGTRGLDLCSYHLPESLKPDPVTILKGDLGWPLPDGDITVNLEFVNSKEVEEITLSREDGTFAHVMKIPEGEDVVLTVQGDNVGYQSTVVLENGTATSSSLTIDLQVTEANSNESFENQGPSSSFVLDDIQFATREDALLDRPKIMLKSLANRMEREPNLSLSIEGHTDNVGDARENMTLSESRATSVKSFLMELGIAEERLSTAGFGETSPKASNETAEGRRINRRTEFRWIQED